MTEKNNLPFEVEEGSNYAIYMTYEKKEVITFEQFKKLVTTLFKSGGDYIAINKIIVQKKDIRMLEPTRELTREQKRKREDEERTSFEIYLK